MKRFLLAMFIFIFAVAGYGQDSARTRNDKPGTPQSLRTTDNSPHSKVTIINNGVTPNQVINHGAIESNEVNNNKQLVIVPNVDSNNNTMSPQPPATIINKPVNIHDTLTRNGKSNVSNPTRK